MKEMEARRRDFIKNIISGKIAAIKDEAGLKDEVWKALMTLGSSVYEYSIKEFYTDINDCELTVKEKQTVTEKIREQSVLHQMLIIMHNTMKMTSDFVDYGGQFSKKHARKLMAGYAILEKYGWSFEGEEVQIMDGTHEFYVPEVKKNE